MHYVLKEKEKRKKKKKKKANDFVSAGTIEISRK
jgi:hypothetical protein